MSIAKSITATLIGAALQQGKIAGLDDPVTKYVPALLGSAYEGVSIRDILLMSSGVRWNEAYTDPASDRRRLLEVQIAQQPGEAIELMRRLPRAAPPGTVNTYDTGETLVAGEVVHAAVKRPLSDYLGERIWRPFGMESDATWWLASPDGIEIAGSGFSATLRDYARFGLFVMGGGRIGNEQVLPPGWSEEAGSPKTLKNGKKLDYGFFLVACHAHAGDAGRPRGVLGGGDIRSVPVCEPEGAHRDRRVGRAIETRRDGHHRQPRFFRRRQRVAALSHCSAVPIAAHARSIEASVRGLTGFGAEASVTHTRCAPGSR